MAAGGRIGLSGLDTRALTQLVRREGPPTVVIAHSASGEFDLEALRAQATAWPGLEGMDLAKEVSREQVENWSGGSYSLDLVATSEGQGGPHVVAIDYGAKRNIFRNLVEAGALVTILPATATYDDIMAHAPDGFFLSNGPGDPAATGEYAVPVIRQLLETKLPLFGICLGHQLLALAVGGVGHDLAIGGGSGEDGDPGASLDEVTEDVAFRAIVDRDDVGAALPFARAD